MNVGKIQSNLTQTYIDWNKGKLLVNPNFKRTDNLISWSNYGSFFFEQDAKIKELSEAEALKQYSFQCKDGSIIQIYYQFNREGEALQNAKLAYYGIPKNYDSFAYDDLENLSLNSIRIDYAPAQYKGVLHHDCHLHISGLGDSRLIVKGIPTPKQFLEFIASVFYQCEYQAHRLDNNGLYRDQSQIAAINQACFSCDNSDLYHWLTHVYIPTAS